MKPKIEDKGKKSFDYIFPQDGCILCRQKKTVSYTFITLVGRNMKGFFENTISPKSSFFTNPKEIALHAQFFRSRNFCKEEKGALLRSTDQPPSEILFSFKGNNYPTITRLIFLKLSSKNALDRVIV